MTRIRAFNMRRAQPDFSQPPNATSDWLTTTEVATLLRVHPKHIYRLLHQGMPARRVGGQWRFSREAIMLWADQRGDALCAAPDAAVVTLPASITSLVAIDPSEISVAVAMVLGDSPATTVGMVHTTSERALSLLTSGEVVAAIVRREDASFACATVRIGLGSRQIGLVSGEVLAEPESITIPSGLDLSKRSLATWLQQARERGTLLHQADSEIDACAQVLRGEVDAALCSGSWARRFALAFRLLHVEPWEMAVRVDAMEDPNVSRICSITQSETMRSAISKAIFDDSGNIGQMRLERGVERGLAQLIAPSDESPSFVPSNKARTSARWTVLLRDRPEQMLDLVEQLRGRGLKVGGFVQVPSGPTTSKPLGYDLYRCSQPERIPLAERVINEQKRSAGEHFCELSFHSSALVRAGEWLKEDLGVCDLLIIDGVGRLEERGEGLFPAIAWARMQERAKLVILSSKRSHIPELARRLALLDTSVGELSFGNDATAPAQVVDRIVQTCERNRRGRAQKRPPK